jgi:D-galactarolactone cycloisomerase
MDAVGRAIEGRGIALMVDTNHAYGVGDAVRLGLALAPYGLRWYEEPVAPEHVAGYREVRSRCAMPIAGGENEHTLYGFRDFLAAGAVDIAQPDIGSVGGFTACRHVIALAQAHGVQVNPHVWGSAVAQAASLQLIAAVPVAHHSVFADEPIFEYDRSSHPFRQSLVAEPIVQRDGWLEVPTRPGLGVELVREVLERYRA